MCADAFDTVPGQPRAVERPARGFGKVDHRGAAGLAADIRHADAGDRSAHRHGAGSHCGNQMSSMLAKVTRIVWPMATLSGSAPTTPGVTRTPGAPSTSTPAQRQGTIGRGSWWARGC